MKKRTPIELELLVEARKLDSIKESKKIREKDYELSPYAFVLKLRTAHINPNSKGSEWENYNQRRLSKYLIKLSKNGDFKTKWDKIFEFKFSMPTTKSFNIKNIRTWEKIDYFYVMFVDVHDDYQQYHLVLNNDAIINNPNLKLVIQNHDNQIGNIKDKGLGISLPLDKMLEKLLPHNLLNGTEYEDVEAFLEAEYKKHTKVRKASAPRKAMTKYAFNVDRLIIDGPTNNDSVIKLIEYLKPENVYGKIWPSSLSLFPDKWRNVKMGDYYLNPHFSKRDIETNINNLNKKANLNIRIIEK
jgi:hypothetical protein